MQALVGVSRHQQASTAIIRNQQPLTAISSCWQPLTAINSNLQPLAAINSHYQLLAAISSHKLLLYVFLQLQNNSNYDSFLTFSIKERNEVFLKNGPTNIFKTTIYLIFTPHMTSPHRNWSWALTLIILFMWRGVCNRSMIDEKS